MPIFVDTNVLVYARDATEIEKQPAAQAWLAWLWEMRAGRLSMQVLTEYYVTVTRKLRPGLPPDEAQADVRDLLSWSPVEIDVVAVEDAWAVERRFGLAFWEGLIVAAARASGCRHLLTEDLQHGQDLDGVLIVNPFVEAPGSLD